MINHENAIKEIKLEGKELKDVTKKILVGPRDGFDGYFRIFKVAPGGYTPYHKHPWWHVNYVLEGEGKIVIEGKDNPIKKGSTAFIEENVTHQFVNTGNTELKFICLVPKDGDSY